MKTEQITIFLLIIALFGIGWGISKVMQLDKKLTPSTPTTPLPTSGTGGTTGGTPTNSPTTAL